MCHQAVWSILSIFYYKSDSFLYESEPANWSNSLSWCSRNFDPIIDLINSAGCSPMACAHCQTCWGILGWKIGATWLVSPNWDVFTLEGLQERGRIGVWQKGFPIRHVVPLIGRRHVEHLNALFMPFADLKWWRQRMVTAVRASITFFFFFSLFLFGPCLYPLFFFLGFCCFLLPFYPRFPNIPIPIPIWMYISHPIPFVLISISISSLSYFIPINLISSASQPMPHNPTSQFTVRHQHHLVRFFVTHGLSLLSILRVYVWCAQERNFVL